jgi:hypothetical protein
MQPAIATAYCKSTRRSGCKRTRSLVRQRTLILHEQRYTLDYC